MGDLRYQVSEQSHDRIEWSFSLKEESKRREEEKKRECENEIVKKMRR
jgi:hypothetical protein